MVCSNKNTTHTKKIKARGKATRYLVDLVGLLEGPVKPYNGSKLLFITDAHIPYFVD
jgi:hypothetical protein